MENRTGTRENLSRIIIIIRNNCAHTAFYSPPPKWERENREVPSYVIMPATGNNIPATENANPE